MLRRHATLKAYTGQGTSESPILPRGASSIFVQQVLLLSLEFISSAFQNVLMRNWRIKDSLRQSFPLSSLPLLRERSNASSVPNTAMLPRVSEELAGYGRIATGNTSVWFMETHAPFT